MAGRPPKKDRTGNGYGFIYPEGYLSDLDIIAKREGISRKALLLRWIKKGIDVHLPGNFQTQMPSYGEGGEQTVAQMVGRARQFFLERGRTSRSEILQYLKEKGIPGPERVSICGGLVSWLKDKIEVTI